MKLGAKIPLNHMPKGKGSRQEFLPSRFAMTKLAEGNPAERSTNEYARRTPSGASAPNTYTDIMAMGQKGIDIDQK
jgi:hypothetical protein